MITGYFESISVPEVAVGEDIKATIDFYALNPGALYWKTFLIVDSPGLNLRKVLDAAREIGQEGGREKTYTLGKMPNKDVAISFFLFAHDDAGYDWDWSEYEDWMTGFAIEVTHLASEYKFLEPSTPEPELETLEIDITPSNSGYVTTSPPPAKGVNHFEDGDTGEFEHGEIVYVTAHPDTGYLFKSWSGEMTDTSDNPAPVYAMTEHRRITAHFDKIEPGDFSGMILEVEPAEFEV